MTTRNATERPASLNPGNRLPGESRPPRLFREVRGQPKNGKVWRTTLEQRFAEVESNLSSSRKRLLGAMLDHPEDIDSLDTETRYLEFRTEFFNAFNTPSFSNPNLSVGTVAPDRVTGKPSLQVDPTFGQITSTSVAPRVIQFALKFYF